MQVVARGDDRQAGLRFTAKTHIHTVEQVTNGFGMKFDKEIFTWTDGDGSRITVESIYSKVGEGRIVMDSASSVEAEKVAEKSLIKIGKENL